MEFWDFDKNSLSPYEVGPGSNFYAFWICKNGHSFKTMVYSMANSRKGMNCPICSNYIVKEGFNDLATTHPHLISEWDFDKNELKPTEVHAGMQKNKFWWKCSKGHSWQATIQRRASRGDGCPICSNKKILAGYNDTVTLYPDFGKYWNYEKNVGLSPLEFKSLNSTKKSMVQMR